MIYAAMLLRVLSLLYSASCFYADYTFCEWKDSFQIWLRTADLKRFSLNIKRLSISIHSALIWNYSFIWLQRFFKVSWLLKASTSHVCQIKPRRVAIHHHTERAFPHSRFSEHFRLPFNSVFTRCQSHLCLPFPLANKCLKDNIFSYLFIPKV